jgi:uncharacterized protein YciI
MTDSEQTYMLQYKFIERAREQSDPYRDAHLEHIRLAKEAGNLFVVGGFGEPLIGAVLGFQGLSKSEVEDWSDRDSFWTGGLIVERMVEPWFVV